MSYMFLIEYIKTDKNKQIQELKICTLLLL